MVSGALITVRDISPDTTSNRVREEMLQTLQSQSLILDRHTEEALQSASLALDFDSDYHPVTLRPIIVQAAKGLQRTNPAAAFEFRIEPDLPFAVGHEGKIELALLNLIESAVALNDSSQPILISARSSEDSVCITVEGTRLDDPPQQQTQPEPVMNVSSVSKHFVSLWAIPQVKLYIAAKLIEAQGGYVWAEDISERSTRFNFSLPKIEVQDVVQALADR
jgi:signal transduction histidine kinase